MFERCYVRSERFNSPVRCRETTLPTAFIVERVGRLSLKSPAALPWPTRGLSIGGQGDHHLRCGDHSVPPSEPFNIVLLKRTSAAVAMASFI